MAKPKRTPAKIADTKGREIRFQPSQDRHFIDLYLGPEKTRHHSRTVKWFAAHRIYTNKEAGKLLKRLTAVVKQLR